VIIVILAWAILALSVVYAAWCGCRLWLSEMRAKALDADIDAFTRSHWQ